MGQDVSQDEINKQAVLTVALKMIADRTLPVEYDSAPKVMEAFFFQWIRKSWTKLERSLKQRSRKLDSPEIGGSVVA